jgi:hypothetical protein
VPVPSSWAIAERASGFRPEAPGVPARLPEDLGAESLLALDERNGFTLLDFDRRTARVQILGCPRDYVSPANLDVAPAFELELV